MKNLIIRKATSEDKVELLSLEQKVVEAERPYNASIKTKNATYYDLNHLLLDDDSNLLVAEINGVIIGSGYGQIRGSKKSLEHSTHTYLGFMYVEIEYRGLGINKMIMDNLIDWSKNRGVVDLYLDVYDANDAAIRAYKKVGFTKTLVEMKINLSD
ncbi:GNAT family N-acetyltransferase [Shewanella donghaensis]|uniref:GNAT family N-acetyltransferase n=1 Tax=Shewanella donghaensis TaxID=238836 RepID=UPI0011829B74|nr:GNAT family N-acetyltransferase [Shewanella donghaensis]